MCLGEPARMMPPRAQTSHLPREASHEGELRATDHPDGARCPLHRSGKCPRHPARPGAGARHSHAPRVGCRPARWHRFPAEAQEVEREGHHVIAALELSERRCRFHPEAPVRGERDREGRAMPERGEPTRCRVRRPPSEEEDVMKLKKGFRQLVDEAKSRITTLSLEEARARHGRDDVTFVDLRDVRELDRARASSSTATAPGAPPSRRTSPNRWGSNPSSRWTAASQRGRRPACPWPSDRARRASVSDLPGRNDLARPDDRAQSPLHRRHRAGGIRDAASPDMRIIGRSLASFGRRWQSLPRRRRWPIIALLVIVVAVYSAAYLLDEPLRRYVEREVNHRLTGYTVTIPKLSLHPHTVSFDLLGVTIVQDANPRVPVADIQRLNTTIHWRALLHRRVVADVTFARPRLHIDLPELRAEAKSKVPLKDKGWQQALEAVALDLEVNRLQIIDGAVTYIDQGPFKPLELSHIALV